MADRFPRPYVNDAKKDEEIMVYVPFETMGIGARKSGLPNKATDGSQLNIEHVGDSTGNGNSARRSYRDK